MTTEQELNKVILQEGEQEIARFGKHKHFFFWPAVATVFVSIQVLPVLPRINYGNPDELVTLMLFLFPLVWLFLRLARRKENYLLLTNKRLILSRGTMYITVIVLPLDQLERVTIRQSWIGRLLGSGNLVLKQTGTKGVRIFKDINDPVLVRQQIAAAAKLPL